MNIIYPQHELTLSDMFVSLLDNVSLSYEKLHEIN